MIGLAKELSEHSDLYELHCLLGALFSQELTQNERLNLINKEYNIPIDDGIRKDVSVICNLSQGIKEAGMAAGIAQVVTNMYNNGFTLEQIVIATGMDLPKIKAIITEKENIKNE